MRASRIPRLRCAVYTRKSTEEGLDQEFNSLDAQHEACAAFIASQVGLGWKLLSDRYDDGGISGGTMDRPALQRLLQDIRDRKVDVVVVYKIDRLTRSLMDFSRIVEIFDAAGVSFVSVTQQFNTTTSMGRLTLNVLLSFAQFEREVTAERIRDKIAASKAKGLWMGGRVPFGYRVEDRKLVVDEPVADTVRWMFDRYLELRSVAALTREIEQSRRMPPIGRNAGISEIDDGSNVADIGTGFGVESGEGGAHADGANGLYPDENAAAATGRLSRGKIAWMLANPIYIGKLRHHGKVHDGQHEPIVNADLFERVQRQLAVGSPRRSSASNNKDMHLLTGVLFDETGERLSPTSTSNHGKRYRYYVSSHLVRCRGHEGGRPDGSAPKYGNGSGQDWRIPAEMLDRVALDQLGTLLADKVLISDWLRQHALGSTEEAFRRANAVSDQLEKDQAGQLRWELIRKVLARMVLSPTKITFHVQPQAILDLVAGVEGSVKNNESALEGRGDATGAGADGQSSETDESSASPIHVIELPILIRRRGQEQRIVIEGSIPDEPDARLVDLLGRAHFHLQELTSGSFPSIADLADHLGVHRADVSRILPLAFLSPAITDAIVSGKQPTHLTPHHLSRLIDIPSSWREQGRALGI